MRFITFRLKSLLAAISLVVLLVTATFVANAAGAAEAYWAGKRILIADDTLTTGATASALAEVLKKAGAAAVYLVTVASVEKQAPFGYRSESEIP